MSITAEHTGLKAAPVAEKPSDVILSVNGISKKFCRNLRQALGYAMVDIGSEIFGVRSGTNRKLRKNEFWALEDVSFELRRGDAVGLVGANGAGKTTLLKVISGLIKPDKGSVTVRGHVAPLIALGAGFNPILSGRENIYVNMSILGLTKEQIDQRFDIVVGFAEIGHAIDAPVQTYSSGMSARLGFACAVHSDPDILLVDEVLAVGDMRFRAKCYRKLAELRKNGTTLLLVSHSAQSLSAVCSEGILLKKGTLISSGSIGEVLSDYENSLTEILPAEEFKANTQNEVFLGNISFKDTTDNCLYYGRPVELVMDLNSKVKASNVKLQVIVRSTIAEGDYVVSFDSARDGVKINLNEGVNSISLNLDHCGFKAGAYTMKLAVVGENHYVYDAIESFRFYVKNDSDDVNSTFYQQRSWEIK